MKSVLILTFSLAAVQHVAAVCNVCTDSAVACISENGFYRCQNGKPDNSTTYVCPRNEICTILGKVCAAPAEGVPACGDTSQCGICDGTEGTYACTSYRTYTMCLDGALSDIRDTCAENQVCDIERGKLGLIPCVPNCREPEIQFCGLARAIDEPIDETTVAPTTATTTALPEPTETTTNVTTTPTPTSTAAAFCSQQTAAGYYSAPNDSTCRNYILCYRKGGVMQATAFTCPNDTYFITTTRLCQAEKPQDCI